MASPLADLTFKYQRIWLNAVMKPGQYIPVCFKKDTAYKCNCVDSTYGRPDPSCVSCGGTGYNNQAEIANRKWVLALSAPLDKEAIYKYELGGFTASARILLISYPISPEYTRLYGTQPTLNVKNADGIDIEAEMGWIVQPEDRQARIVFQEKLWNGVMWEVKELEFYITHVESYKVSEFPIGQKLILKQATGIPGNKRFIPEG